MHHNPRDDRMNAMEEHEDDPRLQDLARAEAKTVRDLIDEAVDFYTRLPAAARRSLRAMATLADDKALSEAAHAAGRGIVQAGMDVARQRGRQAAGRAYPNGQFASEQEVEREAVRLSREAWPAHRPAP
jgi:hypothetical protein